MRSGGMAAALEPVEGAANEYLNLSGAGYIIEHKDVRLWYHGTIDTIGEIFDGEISLDPDAAGWYSGSNPGPRTKTGFDFTQIAGNERQRPLVGLHEDVRQGDVRQGGQGQGTRQLVTDLSNAAWPNVIDFRVESSDFHFTMGELIRTTYYYQDYDSNATITFYLDPDRNPYDHDWFQTDERTVLQSGRSVLLDGQFLDTAGIPAGRYFVAAKIQDSAGHTRYAYAPQAVTLSPATMGDFLAIDRTPWDDDNSRSDRDSVVETGERADLRIRLKNVGNSAVSDVDVQLISTHSGVDIPDNYNWYESITPSDRSYGEGDFAVDLNFGSAGDVQFLLELNYKVNGTPYFQFLSFENEVFSQASAEFSVSGYTVNDSPSISSLNNGDGHFQSGEKVEIRPQLRNVGSRPATDIVVSLIPDGQPISIPGGGRQFPDLDDGDASYPSDGKAFKVYAPRDFTGVATVDVQVEWDQATGPVILTGALRIDVEPTPWMDLSSEVFNFGAVEPGATVSIPIQVSNIGSSLLNVTNVEALPGDVSDRVNIDVTHFSLNPGDPPITVTIEIDTAGLENGTQIEQNVRFTSNTHNATATEDEVVVLGLVSSEIQVFQLPATAIGSDAPDISGPWIVWDEAGDIFAYSVATYEKRQITSDPTAQREPRISGDLIVWNDERNGGRDQRDIYAYDLTSGQEFVISDSIMDEELIGIDNGKVAFARAYFDYTDGSSKRHFYNLWMYDHAAGSLENYTEFTPGGSTDPKNSIDLAPFSDYGGGTLVWQEETYIWDGARWDHIRSDNRFPQFQDRLFVEDTVAANVDGWTEISGADNHRFVWADIDSSNDGQVWLWDNGQIRPVTPGDDGIDEGDEFIAIGGDFVAFDKEGSGPFYKSATSAANEAPIPVTSLAGRPAERSGRMDQNGLVWLNQKVLPGF